ncbi:thiolase family protein [Rhodococcus sp. BP-149]|uniref:thiolase family protein n=1 Tax=unclassified Rhodococcus (in: high G+C Gram-positive bacteria) TaxID=192944 RepID=UPI001C9B0C88|nr:MULTISPECIES: thiolase family protein [unclassified Rhodococcus (in: high G+C Gram-positive bacteria)]MBY6687790.1 thiolase family protein [Rhodococcus sp. BP-288]MBY6696055.1 thiolase family protein [Rhodococcus sp. BP-188]MBY6700652.1 thiolase family protein [Rhodococcus sp. BP-285]MBY6705049.1 thiolase family protein [Rhodococcus sp. BP-283]MBY6713777.1 thiolase family protein [Rhodococcus sp. BP-160]
MNEPVVVSAVRTPVGTAMKGTLRNTSAETLATHILAEAVRRSGFEPGAVDDVVFAESMYGGGDLARYAAVAAGMVGVPGLAVNRHCTGSLSAVGIAASTVRAGMESVVVAGGVQSTSMMPRSVWRIADSEETETRIAPTFPYTEDAADDTSLSVGWNIAQKYGLSREQMDAWAVRSHRRAVTAIDAGTFDDEITPIKVTMPDGSITDFAVDEHPRRTTSLEKAAAVTVIHPEIEGFSISAANACGSNDAAAALTLTSAENAAANGIDALATVRSWVSVGVDPKYTGDGALAAIRKILTRADLRIEDVHLWEINEAFASVPVAACREFGIDEDLVNIHGSGCSLGHPIAATGARMLTTLIHELRRRGGGTGVAAMCAGGGQGGAVVVDVR